MARTLRLETGELVYRPVKPESAGKVFYVPKVSWIYLSQDAARAADPDCVAVPFLVQEPMEFLVGSPEGLLAQADRGQPTPRTAPSAFVAAARALSRDGLDGVALRSDGKVSAVFVLDPERRLRRVEEAFRRGLEGDADDPGGPSP